MYNKQINAEQQQEKVGSGGRKVKVPSLDTGQSVHGAGRKLSSKKGPTNNARNLPFVCQTQSSLFLRHFLGLPQRSPSLDCSGSCLGPLFGNIINLMMSSIKPKNGGNNKYLFLCLLEVINKLNDGTKDFKKAPGSSRHLLRLLRRSFPTTAEDQ